MLLGTPQDIEWVIADGQVWLLQSRPITTPPADQCVPYPPGSWADDRDRRALWQLEPFVSVRPRLPLDREVSNTFFVSLSESAQVKGDEGVEQCRVFYGRRYVGTLPSPLREGDRRVRRAAYLRLIERVRAQGLPMWEHWAPEVVTATRQLGAFDVARADGPALAEHLEDAFGTLVRHWTCIGSRGC